MLAQRKEKLKKIPVKTLILHLRLILGPEIDCNNQKSKNNTKQTNKTKTPWKEENLISRVTTLLDSNIQFLTTTTTAKPQSRQGDRKVWPIKKKINQ